MTAAGQQKAPGGQGFCSASSIVALLPAVRKAPFRMIPPPRFIRHRRRFGSVTLHGQWLTCLSPCGLLRSFWDSFSAREGTPGGPRRAGILLRILNRRLAPCHSQCSFWDSFSTRKGTPVGPRRAGILLRILNSRLALCRSQCSFSDDSSASLYPPQAALRLRHPAPSSGQNGGLWQTMCRSNSICRCELDLQPEFMK